MLPSNITQLLIFEATYTDFITKLVIHPYALNLVQQFEVTPERGERERVDFCWHCPIPMLSLPEISSNYL